MKLAYSLTTVENESKHIPSKRRINKFFGPIYLIKTDVLFLRHSTMPIFHELEYGLVCVKFPPKIASRMLHTDRNNFHQGSNTPRSF
jgi:hypothetical protein